MAKRGNGEGSITRRKDGLYMARYTVQTATGAKRKALYGKTRGEVSEKLTKAMADRDGGLVFEGGERTLAAFLDGWLDGSVRGSVKPSTYESYERVIRNHLKPGLGRRKLKALAPDHVQHFYRVKLDADLAPGTVRLMHAVLNRALDQAVRWGVIGRNVCKATTPPQPNPEEIKPLDAENTKRLLEAARGNRLEALYVVAVTAGLRIGELLGLKWEDLDGNAGVLRVRRTKSQAKTGPTFTTPKNGKGRSIRLTRQAVEALKAHKAAQNAERLRAGDLWQDNGLVFCTQGGRPLDFHNIRVASFKPLLVRAGLPHMRFHDLRHTCATLLLSRGHHPKLVQELLGHASVALTLDRYSHVLPGMGDQTAAAMEAALS
ncbi:MAG: site-specific integrase [Actinomycetota bacterium]|nr:site-specific integrase [Actinomycetota bacterium]